MGTWGIGTFENDTASDWLGDLETASDLGLLRSALAATLAAVPVDADDAVIGLAAAEVVAALNGTGRQGIPDAIHDWVDGHATLPDADLLSTARAAVDAILERSELRDLWEESDSFAAWQADVEELRAHLLAPRPRPRRARAVKRLAPPADGPGYPFRPRTSASLAPGQFWAVPLSDGRFACGRVLQLGGSLLPGKGRDFFGGLQDWIGDAPPTAEAIAGTGIAEMGIMHVKAITEIGGDILGFRPLELDGIELPLLLSQLCGPDVDLLRGADLVRPARPDEWGTLPLICYWAYGFIEQLGEQLAASRRGSV